MAVPNTLKVTGAGYSAANGTYTRVSDVDGYPAWEKEGGSVGIQIGAGGPVVFWQITELPLIGGGPTCNTIYDSNFAVPSSTWPGEYPSDPAADPVTWGNACKGTGNSPTITAGGGTPSAPTFGLPADVVALITSRFGTVANFLRLRNQGQV